MGEKESMKSAASGNSGGGSSGSPGPPPLTTVTRGHQQPRGGKLMAEPGGWGDDQSYYEDEYYYDESEDDIDDYSRKPVPILLSILLVIIYIVGGAFPFPNVGGVAFPGQRLLLLHHSDDHWFRRLDPGSEDGGRGEEDRPLLPLPPLRHRHDCHELQPGPGGGDQQCQVSGKDVGDPQRSGGGRRILTFFLS